MNDSFQPVAEAAVTMPEASPTTQTVGEITAGPMWRALWEQGEIEPLFTARRPAAAGPLVERIFAESLASVRAHRDRGTLYDAQGKLAVEVLNDLAAVGYWGLRVDPAYGGSGAQLGHFLPFLSTMATLSPTVAGLASVHGCIGAAGAVGAFGSTEQKQRWLPRLARGELHTAFALTEPGAGSDLTAIATSATLEGGQYRVRGEKLFISNLGPGRLIVLVCRIDGRAAVLIGELPSSESSAVRWVDYGLHALRRTINRGVRFDDWMVPVDNRLAPTGRGDGLTIAYHGLNRGRVAVCAVAAGQLRTMLGTLVPWIRHRKTYGAALAERELVRRRLARLAALIVGCDALVEWAAGLLDSGLRAELECATAKIFGSEALKEAAIELMMKTHGGRSFLKGHWWGDNLYDYLTPCVYEGEGEILSLALFRGLLKLPRDKAMGNHAMKVDLRDAGNDGSRSAGKIDLRDAGHGDSRGAEKTDLRDAGHSDLRDASNSASKGASKGAARSVPSGDWIAGEFQLAANEVTAMAESHGGAMLERQSEAVDLSQRIQRLAIAAVVRQFRARSSVEIERLAAELLLDALEREVQPRRRTAAEAARANRLGQWLVDGGFSHWLAETLPADVWLVRHS